MIGTAWYLCGLMLALILAASVGTVQPDGERERAAMIGITSFIAIFFACSALWLRRLKKIKPMHPVWVSKWPLRIGIGVAILLTLIVLSGFFA